MLDRLMDLCDQNGWDYGVRADTASECAWSAEIRVTRQPNRTDGPDRSLVTFAAGGGTADDVIAEAAGDMLAWLGELGEL